MFLKAFLFLLFLFPLVFKIYSRSLGLKVYAGHGLTYKNTPLLVKELKEVVEELNVGHSIISNAILWGMERAVEEFLKLMRL